MLDEYQEELCRSALHLTGKGRFSTTTPLFCPDYTEYMTNMYKVNLAARTCVQDLVQCGVAPTDWPKVFSLAFLSFAFCLFPSSCVLKCGKASKGQVRSVSL